MVRIATWTKFATNMPENPLQSYKKQRSLRRAGSRRHSSSDSIIEHRQLFLGYIHLKFLFFLLLCFACLIILSQWLVKEFSGFRCLQEPVEWPRDALIRYFTLHSLSIYAIGASCCCFFRLVNELARGY